MIDKGREGLGGDWMGGDWLRLGKYAQKINPSTTQQQTPAHRPIHTFVRSTLLHSSWATRAWLGDRCDGKLVHVVSSSVSCPCRSAAAAAR